MFDLAKARIIASWSCGEAAEMLVDACDEIEELRARYERLEKLNQDNIDGSYLLIDELRAELADRRCEDGGYIDRDSLTNAVKGDLP